MGRPQVVSVMVNGVGGMVRATHKGTVRWKLEDDTGVIHTILLPDDTHRCKTLLATRKIH